MKYKLTTRERFYKGIVLYQIVALKNFGNVRKGDLGGFIQSEQNLSQTGECWVYENACISDNAWVRDSAEISGDAWIRNSAEVGGDTKISTGERS